MAFVVESETFIAAPPEVAYAVAADYEAYPGYGVKDLISIRVLERQPGGDTLAEWVWRLKGARVRYVERTRHEPEDLVMRFEQTEGELKRYEGAFRFEPRDGGTLFRLRLELDLGIPMFSGLLDPVARLIIRDTFQVLAEAIKRRAERGTPAGEDAAPGRHTG